MVSIGVGVKMQREQRRLDWLMADYRRGVAAGELTQKEMAEREAEMWALVPPEERARLPYRQIREWARKEFGGSSNDYMNRDYLLRAEGSDTLFRRVQDKRMALSRAVELHRKAKRLADEQRMSLVTALSLVLDEYEKLPVVRYENGYAIRGNPVAGIKARVKEPKYKRKTAKDPKAFYAKMRDLIATYAQARLDNMPPELVEQRIGELETEVNETLRLWSERIAKDRTNAARRAENREVVERATAAVTRRAYVKACQTLNIQAAKPGKPVDLEEARKQRRKLVRAYHPDMQGNDATRAAYEAVNEAWEVVQSYADQVGIE